MEHIIEVVKDTLSKANVFYNKEFPMIPIRNDIKGKCAGQFCVRSGSKYLRFNPVLYKENKDTFDETIVHEVAHYIAYELFTGHKPHGKEWKSVMAKLGAKPNVTHKMNIANVPTRKGKTFTYKCKCREYDFSSVRHKRSMAGKNYYCTKCKSDFIFQK